MIKIGTHFFNLFLFCSRFTFSIGMLKYNLLLLEIINLYRKLKQFISHIYVHYVVGTNIKNKNINIITNYCNRTGKFISYFL